MEYTTMEKLGARVSRLGFGCMRFPTTTEGKIDEARTIAMLDEAYRAGVNYFDTAYFYHHGESEPFLGRALKRYPRESFYLATKMPMSIVKSLEQAKEIFEGQFEKLQVEVVDFYLLHALDNQTFTNAIEMGILDYLIQQQKLGRIRYLGFSFHDDYAAFERILTYREWDFCQIQFNYMDVDTQAGMKGYELATRMGVPVVVMEPVKGGSLATLSEDIADIFKAVHPDKSIASWAMRWVASLPNCRVVLSGMSSEEQVRDNLQTFADAQPLSEEELAVIDRAREAIRAKVFIGCTSCSYCMPCPAGVNIPRNFRMMNNFAMYHNERSLRAVWKDMKEQERAGACVGCGKCEGVCPQQLPIREKLAQIAQQMA